MLFNKRHGFLYVELREYRAGIPRSAVGGVASGVVAAMEWKVEAKSITREAHEQTEPNHSTQLEKFFEGCCSQGRK